MFTFNGIGTKLYGNKKIPDIECKRMDIPLGSYIATIWFVIFFLPIIPLSSHIVVSGKYDIFSTKYQMIKLNKIYWKQVLRTYLCILGIVLGIVLIFMLRPMMGYW